ncbi:hypothetical protein VZC37_12890 [Gordonia sp. LSe1-13]|uniref:Uncharacterized protein n=1 Tax=Gordonia sesuvii TaxID=3116777 RepID=A0ABU7MDS3_9ACTN|nr:hypothetical protein [Gordonia sp. LSe1-13]
MTRRSLLPALILLVGVVAACSSPTDEASQSRVDRYLGKWNYDQPDPSSGLNMAELALPTGPQQAPQVGDVVFTRDPQNPDGDIVIGRTDVGCTWRFHAGEDALRLDPPAQLCNNPTSNVSYTITSWTATVDGDAMTEKITAKSHRADRDLDFALPTGARTRTDDGDGAAVSAFVGTWRFDAADPASMRNISIVRGADGVRPTPEQGAVLMTADYGNRITAQTDDGCVWSMLVRGNTAKLDPPVQTCPRPGNTTRTIRSWTAASDGTRQTAIVHGTNEQNAPFTLGYAAMQRV